MKNNYFNCTLLFILSLVPLVSFGQHLIYSNDFSNPSDWTMTNNSSPSRDWVISTSLPSNLTNQGFPGAINSTSGGNFAWIDSDGAPGGTQDAFLTLVNAVDCSSYGTVKLTFQNYHRRYMETHTVQVSNDNGATWTEYPVNAGFLTNTTSPNPVTVSLDISSAAANQGNVRIRFRYRGAWDWFWAIDDVALVADIPPAISAFSPLNATPGSSVTISGEHFNTTAANNIVYFGGVKAMVTAASATSLTVTVPLGAMHDRITVLNTVNNLSASSPVPFSPSFSPNKNSIAATDFAAGPSVAGAAPLSVAYGDFDGDGRVDMAVANASPGSVSVFQNTGSAGTVSYTEVLPGSLSAGNSPRSVAIADIDGDGKPDLVVTDPTSSPARIHVFRNTSSGSGNFSFSSMSFITGANILSVAIGDIDGDGRPDLAVTGEYSGTGYIYVHRNLGSGPGSITFDNAYTTLSAGPAFGTGVGIVIADINRDGKAELVTTNVGDQVLIFPNTSTPGSVSFDAAIARTAAGTGVRYVAVGDLDGDGMPDIAVASGNADNISVFRNTGVSGGAISIATTDAGPFPAGDNPYGIVIGDINGDGKPDIVTANNTAGSISILRNTSTGIGNIGFAAGLDLASGSGARYPVLADMDGDGRLDIAVANQSANTVSFFRNAPIIPDASGIVYVNANAPAPVGDGSSWATAYNDLAPVLAAAKADPSIQQIWVAKGTYKPKYRADNLSGANPTDRNNAFVLVENVKLYGGFSGDGTETDINDRTLDGSNETILSGDLHGDDAMATGSGSTLVIPDNINNAYHVIISAGEVGTAELNGFTITGGYAASGIVGIIAVNTFGIDNHIGGGLHINNSSPEISHVRFIHNFGFHGGGMSILYSSPRITHSVFSENQAASGGGGFMHHSAVKINHSVFSGNRSTSKGGGIYVQAPSDLTVTSTVFSGNHSDGYGGGMYSDNTGRATFTNTTMVGNTSTNDGAAIYKINSAPLGIRNSIIWGTIGGIGTATMTTASSLIEGSAATANGNIDATGITQADIFNDPANPVGADGIWGTADDGLQLKYSAANPVINAGDNNVFDAGQTPDLSAITTDIAGNPRKRLTVDAGAYELSDYGPAAQASSVTVSNLTSTSATVSWANGDGGKRVVFVSQGSTGVAVPVDGTSYTANAVFGAGTEIGGSGWYAVYNGTGTTLAVTGLTAATPYRVMVVEYNETLASGGEDYLVVSATENPVNFTTLATLDAIVRADANPTNATTVAYTVTFGSAVSGLTTANFSLTTGIADASVVSVSPVGADETTYTVTVGTGSGDGDITLELSDATGLTPGLANTLPVVGETYTIDKTAPVLTAVGIVSDNADASRAGVGNVITLDFTSSEAIAAPTVTIATHTVTATNTAGNDWTASYTLTASDAEGTVPFSITYSDLVGNAGTAVTATTDGSSVTVLSSDAALQALTLSSGTLSPAFSSTVYQYAASVPYATASVTLVPTADEKMLIEVNGVVVASGTASQVVTLNTGSNTVEVAVTSENGTVTQHYTLTITRAKATQVITFAALEPHTFGDMDIDPGATASSGLAIAYVSDNPAVATIVGGKIQIAGAGTATITASQGGNAQYLPAPDVTRTLIVERRPVTIGFVADAVVSKEYDGTTMAVVTVDQLSFMAGDVLAGDEVRIDLATASAAYDTEGAGTDKLVTLPLASVSLVGADAKNYRISNSAAITANAGTIARRALTITANNDTKLFDGEAYSGGNGVVYGGFIPGENASVLSGTLVYGGSAQGAVDAGSYDIIPSGLQGANYAPEYRSGTLLITSATRSVVFPALPEKVYGDADFDPEASASSGEAIGYTSSNPQVAEIVNGSIRIRGAGTTTITATVPENANYSNRPEATQVLTVGKATQTISMNPPAEVNRNAGAIPMNATASSGLPVSLSVDDTAVAALNGSTLNILRLGTVRITATQAGDGNYLPAESITVTIRVVDPDADLPVSVHQAVSPNGDGINEFLMIEGIRDYPENRVTIFNRNGTMVWEASGYDNAGVTFRGIGRRQQRLPAGTYFYLIEVRDGGTWKQEKGYFVLKY